MAHHGTGSAHAVLDGLDFNTALQECLACAVFAANDEGHLTLLSPEAELLLGLKAGSPDTRTVDSLPVALRALVAQTLLTSEPVPPQEIALHDKTGIQRTFRVSTFVSPTQSGKPREVVTVLHDLTAGRLLESNLRWLDRLAGLGTLSASMAHEVKNALVAVKTFVDLGRSHSELANMADLVSREIRRIDSILTQMLRFAGPSKASFAPIHVHDILEHALGVIRPQIDDRGICLVSALDASSDLVRGDEYQLEQAFLNLLLNAVDATNAKGRITAATQVMAPAPALGTSLAGPALRVDLADTGAGISAEHVQRLFEPFFSTKPGGTGLGLSICRRIVEEHHGRLTVQSQVGQGTTFSVVLPLMHNPS